jgi:antitoxin (DNA-binding transcriptional repressor) of toxin-antitoxin stability system
MMAQNLVTLACTPGSGVCMQSLAGEAAEKKNAIIEEMATVRITEVELARDIHVVLAKVQQGVEVIVEQDHRPVAVIRTPQGPGRKISECIALAKAYEEKLGYAPVPDPDFAKDVQAAIDAHREPFSPPPWD